MKRSVLACAILLLAAAIQVSMPAGACSIAGPTSLVGFVVIYDFQAQQQREIRFDEVGIGSQCEIANSMDISEYGVMLWLSGGVRLFNLNGAILKDLRLEDAYEVSPRLDSNFLYYVDDKESVRRMNADTGLKETVVTGVSAGQIVGLEVSDGNVAWLRYDLDGYRASVFDSRRGIFLLENHGIPDVLGNGTTWPLELIAFRGNNVTFLKNSQELYVYDFELNGTKLLLRLDNYTRTVAQESPKVVYSSGGPLYLFDATTNETTVLMENFSGGNLRLHQNIIVYDFYRVYPGIPGFLVAFAIVTSMVAVVVSVLLLGRRRR